MGGCVKLKSQRSDGVVLISNFQDMTGNVGVVVTSCRLSVFPSIRNSHNHHLDYCDTIALYLCDSMPLAGRPSLVKSWT